MNDLDRVNMRVEGESVILTLGLEAVSMSPTDATLWAQAFFFAGVAAQHGALYQSGVGMDIGDKEYRVYFWPDPLYSPQNVEVWFFEERLTLSGEDLQLIGLGLWSIMQEALRPPLPSGEDMVGLVEEFLQGARK